MADGTLFETIVALSPITAAATVGSGLAWFMAAQFSKVRSLIHETSEKTEKTVLDKLEYHEKHDDTRFNAIQNDLWALRLQNAKHGLNGVKKP